MFILTGHNRTTAHSSPRIFLLLLSLSVLPRLLLRIRHQIAILVAWSARPARFEQLAKLKLGHRVGLGVQNHVGKRKHLVGSKK
jgi:hypothetical protein